MLKIVHNHAYDLSFVEVFNTKFSFEQFKPCYDFRLDLILGGLREVRVRQNKYTGGRQRQCFMKKVNQNSSLRRSFLIYKKLKVSTLDGKQKKY